MTALVTPFRNGLLDEATFQSLCEWQISEGTTALIACGTTGESPVLSDEEHKRIVMLCVETAKKRVPVIAGAGANDTSKSVKLAKFAETAGADAVLVVCPYYNKPSQEGLYQHFKAVAEATALPIILYNIPGRSVVDMSVDTMKRLSEIKNIIGVKDATANLARVTEQRVACGINFVQLSGEDATAVAFNAQGGTGCISVTSNVAPKLCAQMQTACMDGRYDDARNVLDKLLPLNGAMFCETNPAPAKYALSLLGKCTVDVRLPLVPVTDGAKKRIREAMIATGLLS